MKRGLPVDVVTSSARGTDAVYFPEAVVICIFTSPAEANGAINWKPLLV